jgi:tetratricopeptide (TPR) repeat protein
LQTESAARGILNPWIAGGSAMVRTLTLTLAAISAIALAGSALADSGGGGGGGGMPSGSGPSYDPVVEYQKGAAALDAGDYKAAEKAFGKVTIVAPTAAAAWFGLGRARFEQGDAKGARKAFEKAVKLEPDDIPSRAQLGITLLKLNETAKAQAELDGLNQRAEACARTCPEAAMLTAGIRAITAAMPAPAPAAAPAAEPAPAAPSAALDLLFVDPATGDASYGLALGLVNEARYAEALAALAKAQKAFGPHPDVLTYIGYTHRRMGELIVAEDYYRQALAIAPDHRGALEYYGELKVETGDVAGAKLLLARLERACAFGCEQAEELRRWIDAGGEPH